MAFTELGTDRPEFNDIQNMIKQYFKDAFGSDIDVDDPTVAGQLAGILSETSNDIAQLIEGAYNATFVLRAKGSQLDDLGVEWGVYRRPSQFSFAEETIDAYIDHDNPTVIPEWSDFSTADGHVFHSNETLEFNEPTVVVSNSGYISFLTDDDGREMGRQTVQVTSSDTGDDQNVQPDSIVNSDDVDGLVDCFNSQASIGGSDQETDQSFRQRIMQARNSAPAFSDNGIINQINDVNGVTDVKLVDNREMTPNQYGDPGKSIHLYTIGGDDQAVANKLFNSMYPTTKTVGSITKIVTANDGSKYPIRFDHAHTQNVYIHLSLKINPKEFNADDSPEKIRQNVMDYFSTLKMGDTALFSRLFSCAYTEPGVSRVNVEMGLNPQNMASKDVSVKDFQLAQTHDDPTFINIDWSNE